MSSTSFAPSTIPLPSVSSSFEILTETPNKMRRNCNLELRLHPSSYSGGDRVEESSENPENQQQQLTIFYNGRVCVCDVTEIQRRRLCFHGDKVASPKLWEYKK
ncbi:hypothetical protein V6Z12_D10G045500 [Gossypium hirsutum]